MNASLVNPSVKARKPRPGKADTRGRPPSPGLRASVRPLLCLEGPGSEKGLGGARALRGVGRLGAPLHTHVCGARADQMLLPAGGSYAAGLGFEQGGFHAGSLQAPPPTHARGLCAKHCGPRRMGRWSPCPAASLTSAQPQP